MGFEGSWIHVQIPRIPLPKVWSPRNHGFTESGAWGHPRPSGMTKRGPPGQLGMVKGLLEMTKRGKDEKRREK